MSVRKGVTIVEFLVVLGILSLLLAILLPAVQHVREKARETVCKNNLHQINLALSQFVEVSKKLPAIANDGEVGGWAVEILPFLEQGNLKVSLSPGTPISGVSGEYQRSPIIYRCPRRCALDNRDDEFWPATYVLLPGHDRESFGLSDAPVDLVVPWLASPEIASQDLRSSRGPHNGGYFSAKGFQQGISFINASQSD